MFIAAVVVGFPVALAAGWVWSRHSIRAQTAGGLARWGRTFVPLLAIAVIGAAVFGGAGYYFWRVGAVAPAANVTATAAPPEPNSIAVLPFVNMSGDPKREYFSDGISEELLNDLANTPALLVAARTSSFAFKGRDAGIGEIARLLHVRAVLEGSVREGGNRVRITAQLIDAASGYHLWSAIYDRELTDILAVQSDIANAITLALASRFSPGAKPAPAGQPAASIDPHAYRLYLQATDLAHRGNDDDLQKAADLLRTVTAREPDYARGFAALGHVLLTLADRYNRIEFREPAETATREAISLESGNVGALGDLTTILLDRWQWKEALANFQKAQALNPNSADVMHQRSVIAYTFNYPAEDLAAELKASELNPLLPGVKYNLALWYWNNRRYREASDAIGQVLRLRQGKFQDLDQQCAIEVGLGHLDEAQRLAAKLASWFAESPQNSMNCLFYLAIAERNIARARELTDAAAADAEKNGGSFITIGDAYRQIGDVPKAMKWFERAYEVRDPLLLIVPDEKWQTPEPLVSFAPWKALWARQPIREWQAARVDAAKILGVAN